ncbi:mechanosensitive ion channel [Domibacillus sp. DTU_2020_1001157_1_SI_ALB_TIR_016]|uniref:mechanosensitive ion channel n=1 Tax=Domibacillus sp. DTU_2020_1001157_1_SI_ALB_TIR_016 TaxID=3077789 RepID=UPI0028E53451|nr:mechanosensitive ion channel [Domibacillus sp. DTU_2020_1001157_1_SI_ALB_TIR_016]WNS78535.1 mechanosensitive ion channel [Domibacillus sp. DTU_2020_1001157_1_SI_ALB_TIR_016]
MRTDQLTAAFRDMWYTIVNYLPNVLGALLLLVVAWLVATIVRAIFTKGLKKVGVPRAMVKGHMAQNAVDADSKLNSIGKIFYYLVFILFLPSVLDQLNMNAVAAPISNMMDKMLAFLPNLLMAAVILLLGYFVAKFVKNLVAMILGTFNIDKWFNKLTNKSQGETAVSPENKNTLANVLANVVFILILIPIITVALETLGIDSITRPVTAMLNQVLNMIPNIFVAVILITVGVVIARFIGDLLSSLLKGTGIDNVSKYLNTTPRAGMPSFDLAAIIGKTVQVLIIIFFTVEALNVLRLEVLHNIGAAVISYLPLVLSALIILGLGFVGSSLLGNYIQRATGNRLFGGIVKYSIIIMAIFMALAQLNFATSIVNFAFLFVVAGLAVAFALSFGLGGREFAKRQLEKFEARAEAENKKPNNE